MLCCRFSSAAVSGGLEVTTLRFEDFQLREGHWVIADLRGKGGHIRTIPVPAWVKQSVDNWSFGAGINAGPLLRSINKAGRIRGDGFTPKVIWTILVSPTSGWRTTGKLSRAKRRCLACCAQKQLISGRTDAVFGQANFNAFRIAREITFWAGRGFGQVNSRHCVPHTQEHAFLEEAAWKDLNGAAAGWWVRRL